MKLHFFNIVLMVFGILAINIEFGYAQPPVSQAQWSLEKTEAIVGEIVMLQLQVQNIRPPLPKNIAVEGLSIVYDSIPLRQLSSDDKGKIIEEGIVQYKVIPQSPGQYKIPCLEVKSLDGTSIMAREMDFVVQNQKAPIQLTITPSLQEAWVSQPIILQIQFSAQTRVNWRKIEFSFPWLDDNVTAFQWIDCQYPQKYQAQVAVWEKNDDHVIPVEPGLVFIQKINGKHSSFASQSESEENTSCLEFFYAIIPLQPGILNIPAASVQAWLPLQQKNIAISTPDLALKVNPLPDVPQEFSGFVGQYQMESSLQTRNNQNLLHLRLQGQGYLNKVMTPPLLSGDFSYNVENEQIQYQIKNGLLYSEKNWLLSLRPKNQIIRQFPGATFTYFDPAIKQFQTIRQGPWGIPASIEQDTSPATHKQLSTSSQPANSTSSPAASSLANLASQPANSTSSPATSSSPNLPSLPANSTSSPATSSSPNLPSLPANSTSSPEPTSSPNLPSLPANSTSSSATSALVTWLQDYQGYWIVGMMILFTGSFVYWLRANKRKPQAHVSTNANQAITCIRDRLNTLQPQDTHFWNDLKRVMIVYLESQIIHTPEYSTKPIFRAYSVSEIQQICKSISLFNQDQQKQWDAICLRHEHIVFGKFADDAAIRGQSLHDLKSIIQGTSSPSGVSSS